MKYICADCGQEHEDWPALVFQAPDPYLALSPEEKEQAELTKEICCIDDKEGTHWYLRGVLTQYVYDACQYLDYGVWVSLSEESMKDYYEHYEDKEYKTTYFGWLVTNLPNYPPNTSFALPTNVEVDNSKGIPTILPHQKGDSIFIKDFYDGISTEEALRRIDALLNV
ncbi:DUF2199 domain-containing protein [Myroides albus]|uniref:DUF2199 domain-containing protein n=1 Tax=Myroides albus TaxID=2562892 RepID=A0A6I3LIT3_9FLAO|nr:DUF2199 domain-containing protein [Myroides albus]MTG97717.1 DUF2199 domain-containing protein [Myroides albus]UVD78737.1 DUF2199 domain-containing protein [Myroides albus]